MNGLSRLWEKFQSKKYRDAFAASHLKKSIPFQIIAMREKLGMSQEKLAEAANLTQGVVSRAENPNYGNLTFNTVLRIASGLDVVFVGEFVPFSALAKRIENLSEESAKVSTFEEENKVSNMPANEDFDEITVVESIGRIDPALLEAAKTEVDATARDRRQQQEGLSKASAPQKQPRPRKAIDSPLGAATQTDDHPTA